MFVIRQILRQGIFILQYVGNPELKKIRQSFIWENNILSIAFFGLNFNFLYAIVILTHALLDLA